MQSTNNHLSVTPLRAPAPPALAVAAVAPVSLVMKPERSVSPSVSSSPAWPSSSSASSSINTLQAGSGMQQSRRGRDSAEQGQGTMSMPRTRVRLLLRQQDVALHRSCKLQRAACSACSAMLSLRLTSGAPACRKQAAAAAAGRPAGQHAAPAAAMLAALTAAGCPAAGMAMAAPPASAALHRLAAWRRAADAVHAGAGSRQHQPRRRHPCCAPALPPLLPLQRHHQLAAALELATRKLPLPPQLLQPERLTWRQPLQLKHAVACCCCCHTGQ